MTGDAWEGAKRAVSALFGRSQAELGATVEGELEESQRELVAARQQGDDETETELVAEWRGRLRQLLVANPEIAPALRDLVSELQASSPEFELRTKDLRMSAKATGHARVYQQGQGIQHNT
jgi:hypothetical protein